MVFFVERSHLMGGYLQFLHFPLAIIVRASLSLGHL